MEGWQAETAWGGTKGLRKVRWLGPQCQAILGIWSSAHRSVCTKHEEAHALGGAQDGFFSEGEWTWGSPAVQPLWLWEGGGLLTLQCHRPTEDRWVAQVRKGDRCTAEGSNRDGDKWKHMFPPSGRCSGPDLPEFSRGPRRLDFWGRGSTDKTSTRILVQSLVWQPKKGD